MEEGTKTIELDASTFEKLAELKGEMERVEEGDLSFSAVVKYLLKQEYRYDLLSRMEEKG